MRAISVITFLLSVSFASAQDSCGIIWDAPVLLSDTNYNAHSPHIALSEDDTVHIVWWGGGARLPYIRSTNAGQGFEPRRELLLDSVAFPIAANRPSVVAWHQKVYVFFEGATPGIYSPIRMVRSTNGGTAWGYPADISPDTSGPPPLSPTILGDTIVMSYVREGQVPHKILRSTNGGSTWVGVNAGLPNSHSLSLGSCSSLNHGVLHLVQIGVIGNTGETEYRRSHDLGDTWVQQTFISTVDGIGTLDPVVAAGTSPGDATVIAAWRDPKFGCTGLVGCSIIARPGSSGSDSTTWFSEHVLTDIPAGYEPSLSICNRRVAAGWPMDRYNSPFAEVRVSNDTSWCSISDPTAGIQTRYVIAVNVALSSRAVHVVWEASQAADPSTFRIFYRRGVFKTTLVGGNHTTMPQSVRLRQNYPNPFNPSTAIEYRLPKSEYVSLRVYDMLGREVALLMDERRESGEHTVVWNADGLPSGMYYYRLITTDGIETKKALLLK